MKTTHMTTKALYSEHAIARESATIACVWWRLAIRDQKALQWKKGKAEICPIWRFVGLRSLEQLK